MSHSASSFGAKLGQRFLAGLFLCAFLFLIIPAKCGRAAEGEEGEKTLPKLFSGFVDARFRSGSKNGAPQGFTINDGAFYLEKGIERGKLYVDLPFGFDNNAYDTSLADNSFSIGRIKPQAFVKYEVMDKLSFTLGQFDSILGFEATDSLKRMTADFSILTWNLFSFTHTGLLLDYRLLEGLTLSLEIGNGQETGADRTNKKKEVSFLAAFERELYHLYVGGRSDRSSTDSADEKKRDTLLQVIGGLTAGAIDVDLELYQVRFSALADKAKAMGLHFRYRITEQLKLGLRYSHLKSYKSSIYEGLDVTFAANYSLSKDLDLRGDFTKTTLRPTLGSARERRDLATIGLVGKF